MNTSKNMKGYTQDVLDAFKRSRKQLLRMSLISLGITFLSLAVVGTKLFYPFHVIVGVGLYLLSFLPLARRVYLGRKTWQTYHGYAFTAQFFKKEKKRLVAGVLVVSLVAVFLYVRPMDARPFADMSDGEVQTLVQDHLYTAVVAMDYLESTGNELLAVLKKDGDDANRAEEIEHTFLTFLDAVMFSESLTDTHRYFASLPYRLWDERVQSFLISYSLYAKKYELVHRLMDEVAGSEFEKKVLNQHVPTFARSGVYNEMVVRYYALKTRFRLVGGYVYLVLFVGTPKGGENPSDLLAHKAHESAGYLRTHTPTTLARSGVVFTDHVERQMFESWFPVQKGVATAMGRAILTTRGKEGFITDAQALAMQEVMRPGDIMLQRRNWHLSNVGIPGFWTHSALYTGDLATMDEYFASEFPYEGFDTFSSLIKERYPEVYAQYTAHDAYGYAPTVIEAIEQGVVMQSVPVSANADYVVVLRPSLSSRDILYALEKTFAHVGKPYDFNFDFDTRDALVCSELVYDVYFPRGEEKQGLRFETSVVNGRKIVSPMDMAYKYAHERNESSAELSFVYFLRGSEDTQTAHVAEEQDFVESLTWSKFSFLQP
jgi:hypothetical protein